MLKFETENFICSWPEIGFLEVFGFEKLLVPGFQ